MDRAHKAANPGKYPIREDVRAFLPYYDGIEERYAPTRVHLQVYDGEFFVTLYRHFRQSAGEM